MAEKSKKDTNVPNLRFKEFEWEWVETTVGDVMQFRNGKAHENDIDKDGQFIVVNSKFISTNGEVKKFTNVQICPLYKDEIVMVMSDIPNGRALAKCYLIEEDGKYTLNQRICSLKSKNNYSSFLIYLINRNDYYLALDSGVGQTNLRKEEVLNCPLIIPKSVVEQQKIASFLSLINERIQTQSKIIEGLKASKNALSKKIFTQESRFSEFNDEWSIMRLGEVCDIIGGGTPETNKDEYWNGNIQWFTPTEIKSNFVSKSQRTITELGLKNSSAKILPKGTILLTTRATIGEVAIALDECTTNQGFQSLVVKAEFNNVFIFNWIKENRFELVKKAKGSTFPEINKSEIGKIKLQIPTLQEQTKIADFLSAIDEKIEIETSILNLYIKQKQYLLQQMFI